MWVAKWPCDKQTIWGGGWAKRVGSSRMKWGRCLDKKPGKWKKILWKRSHRWGESWNRVSKHLGFEQTTFPLYWSRIFFFNEALNIFREVAFWRFSGRVFHISVIIFWKLFFNLFELNDGGFRFWGLLVTDLVTLMLLSFCSSKRERISGANPFSMS